MAFKPPGGELTGLIAVDDTLGERAYRLMRIATACYFAFITFRWAQDN